MCCASTIDGNARFQLGRASARWTDLPAPASPRWPGPAGSGNVALSCPFRACGTNAQVSKRRSKRTTLKFRRSSAQSCLQPAWSTESTARAGGAGKSDARMTPQRGCTAPRKLVEPTSDARGARDPPGCEFSASYQKSMTPGLFCSDDSRPRPGSSVKEVRASDPRRETIQGRELSGLPSAYLAGDSPDQERRRCYGRTEARDRHLLHSSSPCWSDPPLEFPFRARLSPRIQSRLHRASFLIFRRSRDFPR